MILCRSQTHKHCNCKKSCFPSYQYDTLTAPYEYSLTGSGSLTGLIRDGSDEIKPGPGKYFPTPSLILSLPWPVLIILFNDVSPPPPFQPPLSPTALCIWLRFPSATYNEYCHWKAYIYMYISIFSMLNIPHTYYIKNYICILCLKKKMHNNFNVYICVFCMLKIITLYITFLTASEAVGSTCHIIEWFISYLYLNVGKTSLNLDWYHNYIIYIYNNNNNNIKW